MGVDTIEIRFDKTDILDNIQADFEGIVAQYVVAKVPSEKNEIVEYVQNRDFRYIEDLITVEHDLHEVNRDSLHQRLYDATGYRKMTEEDIEFMQMEIRMGMFSTDRISQDKAFSADISAIRYFNWTDDLLKQGATPYVVLYKGEPAGFIILQTKDGISYVSVLGGGYRKFRKSGLGIIQKEQEIVKKLGGKRVETTVSSNNVSQLKALIINGYIPKSVEHVFVKHDF